MRVSGFPPVVVPQTRLVILGSMPGRLSLLQNQYYANPRNLFWLFMHELFGISPELAYVDRLELLKQAGVGLWDVLKHCERKGSLDSSIVGQTEVPNDFRLLFDTCPVLAAIGFNGQKAEAAFRRHVIPSLPAPVIARTRLVRLPSTSPANASQSRMDKLEQWKTTLGVGAGA